MQWHRCPASVTKSKQSLRRLALVLDWTRSARELMLATGTRLGPFEILAPLGAGGMGEVYRARDTRLDRPVAVKVLPHDKISDPERKRRFVQEAKAASALNHPNIVTIYDIGQAEGIDFIAMEYVDGRTLEDLVGRKGLKLTDALKYGVQIADALAAAHAAGIIHRDLKPGNVMVTGGGQVKVLDFGIAKLIEPATGELASTRTAVTEEGTLLGTAAYMSPEQAEGRKVDARSDIFSFGAVLYEMITGRRAFQGDSNLGILSAILEKDPTPVSTLVEQTPADLERLVARCLRKDPERRLQHMGDVKIALADLKEEFDSGKQQAAVHARARFPVWAVVALFFILAASAGIILWLTRSPATAPMPTLTRLTWDPGLTTDPALSPDGRLLAYASDRSGEGNLDIYVQQVGGAAPLRLTRDPADEREPAFSPDGTSIVFRSEKDVGGIYIVSALGGPARLIAPGGRRPQFSPDGNWIAYWVGSELEGASFSIRNSARIYVVAAVGGVPRQVQPDFVAAAYPVWSPDSRHILFLGNRSNEALAEESVDWWVTPLDAGPAVKTGALQATRAAKLSGALQVYSWALVEPVWAPDGKSLIFSACYGDSTNLWRIGISGETFKTTGSPQRVTSGPTLEERPSLVSGPGGSLRLAFASLSQNLSIWSLPIEANQGKVVGEVKRLTQDTADDFQPALSPDGARMVFVSTRSGHQEVWIRDMRSGDESALTATRWMKYAPRFSPDGSKVGFAEAGKWNTYIMSSTGGTPEMVCEGCGQLTGWSLDGKRVLCNALDGHVTLLDLDSRRKITLLSRAGHWLCCGRFSPDGHWITFLDGTAFRTYMVPFKTEAPVGENASIDIIDGDGGYWSPDGNLVYSFSHRDGYRCIWAQRLDPATKQPVGAPFAVFHSHNARLSLSNPTEVSLGISGDEMVFNMGERTGNIWMAEWKER